MKDSRHGRPLHKRSISASTEQRAVLILFFAVTLFLLIERAIHLPWDFVVYYMNALHWAGSGSYYEIARAPLASIIFLLLMPFGKILAQGMYIVSICTLFFFASKKLAQALQISHLLWYALHLNAFFLLNATRNGTELLALSLLELGIATIISGKTSGHWFLLAALARYASGAWAIFVLFQKKVSRIIKDLLIMILLIIPWLIYNKLTTGYALTSIANNIGENVKFRYYLSPEFNWLAIPLVLNVLLPFAIIGLGMWVYGLTARGDTTDKTDTVHKTKKSASAKNDMITSTRIDAMMLLIATLIIVSYLNSPIRLDRYLYALILPAAYFSLYALRPHLKWKKIRMVFAVIIIIQFCIAGTIATLPKYRQENTYPAILADPAVAATEGCILHSNAWVFLSYNGRLAEPAPWKTSVIPYLDEGRYILLFKSIAEPEYINDRMLWQNHIMTETDEYILLGKSGCKPIRPVPSYLQDADEQLQIINGQRVSQDPWVILFTNYTI